MLAGIFAGGSATRMGGRDKALLPSPLGGGTLLDRWARLFEELSVPFVVVGNRKYEGYESIPDAVLGVGPLGGLIALLERAKTGYAIAVAVDMPRVSRSSIEALIAMPEAPIVAPKREGRWEPLFARYRGDVAERARENAAKGIHSLQALMMSAVELPLSNPSELNDWDEPSDIR